ncbi:MAG: M23 family metallopeptidase [Corynebacterium sp.]|uniref:M23 family metallopeptidase n=1 Tax=Corynebacterium sp. TaxID=1720 RepID=UPI0026DF58EB|nr:M23 family metallopeptidase [Corynebacterium sp.]MDO5669666.1 M23 family metallopeptidase [Corynebacterium sp.]
MLSRAGITATLLTTALAAGAFTPAVQAQEANFQITDEGVTGADLDDIITALNALGKVAETVNNAESTDEESEGSSDSDLQVILDPLTALLSSISVVSPEDQSILSELEELDVLSDLTDIAPVSRMSPVRGETADGRTVVFPTSGRFTSGYGARWGAMHQGIDIADPIGTPVLAVMDGNVISAGPAQGFGKWVRVQHDDGSISVYGHVHTIDVSLGQRVTAGDQIATIGNEGRSTGPHLHFEIRPDGNNPVDPVTWFAQQGITVS